MSDAPEGYVKIARKLFDEEHGDAFWLETREFSRFEAWLDVIQLARFAPYRHTTRCCVVDLERGEFVASRRYLAKRWSWSEKKVRGWLGIVQKRAQLRAKEETEAGTVYVVVNYETYQGRPDSELQAEGQPKGPARAQVGPKREASKAGKAVTTLSDSPEIVAVLEHYLGAHPRRRVSAKDSKIIGRAIAMGYTVAELCEAIDGNAADVWHREKKKHELEYVLRDTGKIDSFRIRAVEESQPIVVDGVLTEYGERLTRPARIA